MWTSIVIVICFQHLKLSRVNICRDNVETFKECESLSLFYLTFDNFKQRKNYSHLDAMCDGLQ